MLKWFDALCMKCVLKIETLRTSQKGGASAKLPPLHIKIFDVFSNPPKIFFSTSKLERLVLYGLALKGLYGPDDAHELSDVGTCAIFTSPRVSP